jgi:hypothetical protein
MHYYNGKRAKKKKLKKETGESAQGKFPKNRQELLHLELAVDPPLQEPCPPPALDPKSDELVSRDLALCECR